MNHHSFLRSCLLFCLASLLSGPAGWASVRINEVMASNGSTIADEDGDYEDWIELYNAGTEPVNLEGWGLSDSYGDPYKWVFPDVTIEPDGYLLVWASGKDRIAKQLFSPMPQINSDFEDDEEGVSPPTGWTASGNHYATVRLTGDAPSGEYVARVEASASGSHLSGSNSLRRVRPMHIEGDTYLFSFFARSVSGEPVLRFAASSADGTGEVELTAAWQEIAIEYIAEEPYGWTRFALAGPGTFELDHVRFQRVTRELHTNYSLSASGEEVIITTPDGERVDELAPTPLPRDISIGRIQGEGARWFFFDSPTPGSSNLSPAYAEILEPPFFSHSAGFYEEPFALDITAAKGVSVFYTLDGSEPDPANVGGTTYHFKNHYPRNPGDPFGELLDRQVRTAEYSGSLAIGDRSVEADQISLINTWFNPTAQVPLGNLFKATIVRAKAFKDGALPSTTVTRSYFVHPEMQERYKLPVISIVTDERGLFDYEDGIYVPGKVADDWRLANPNATTAFWAVPGNFLERGMAGEQAAHMEIFLPDGELIISNLGLRIHGGASRSFYRKSLRLYPRNLYGDDNSIDYPLLADREANGMPGKLINRYRRLILRNSGNDYSTTLYHDAMIQELVRHLGIDTQGYRPVIHFINGEYWGIINIRERLDENYLESHYGIDPKDAVILINNALVNTGLAADRQDYLNMRIFAEANDLSDPKLYAHFNTLMDVENFATHFAIQVYIGNNDWPHNNIRFWRKRTNGYDPVASQGHDGRWRWMLYDTDLSFNLSRLELNALARVVENRQIDGLSNPIPWSTSLFRNLLENHEFRVFFINKLADLTNTAFRPEHIHGVIDVFNARLESSRDEHFNRWRSGTNRGQGLKTFASGRPEYVRQHVLEVFDLSGVARVTLMNGCQNKGEIRINTVHINSSTPGVINPEQPYPWTGIYFRDVPTEVEAIPATGYRFVGWQGREETEPLLTLTLTEDVTLTAIFELDEGGMEDLVPPPHNLSSGAYSFTYWDAEAPAGTYPAHMIFEQTQQADPGFGTEMDGYWVLPYNLTSRSRINGLGAAGISFINTANAQEEPGAGFLGSAILALNTLGQENIQVLWTGGTVAPNNRPYAIRLQYRVGDEGPFTDLLDEDGEPAEYTRKPDPGHSRIVGPVALPAAAENRPYVQLRWKYYHVGGGTGTRAELRLDDILVTSGAESPPHRLVKEGLDVRSVKSGKKLPPVVVRVLDANGMPATGFNGPVSLVLQNGGQLLGTLTVMAVDGVAVFDDLTFEGAGMFVIRADANGLIAAESDSIRAIRLTELVMPRHMQGGRDSEGENFNRLPFAYRLTIEGLKPDATYRYGNRVVVASDSPEQNGAGNAIFVTGRETDWLRTTNAPRFRATDLGERHHELTTGPDGSYTGWFITEPSGNDRFAAGNDVWLRLLLNDGAGGEEPVYALTLPSKVEVLEFGGAPAQATGIIGEAESGAKNFVLLFDNEEGAGRPLSATPVEITGAEVDNRYATFYQTAVATNSGWWGTLIPNDLAGGIRRIEERSLEDGSLLAVRTFPSGVPGTHNPGGGLNPILLDIEEGEALFLPGDTADWTDGANWSTVAFPDAAGARARITQPAQDHRNVNLRAPVTVGSLVIDNGDSPFRNRIRDRDTGNTLTFDLSSGPATLTVDGEGDGFVEFQVEAGTILASDLTVTVNNVAGDVEFGALRLRESWSGPGGLIKEGDGVLSLTGTGKTYTGPTVVNRGVLSVTEPATPSQTSGVSIHPGGQLRLVSAGSHEEPRIYTFGGELSLNSQSRAGAVPEGEEEGILGALRYDPGANGNAIVVTNDVVVIGPSTLHVDGTRNVMELTGSLGGPGPLKKSGGGTLKLSGDGSGYPGGIEIARGNLWLAGSVGSDIALAPETILSGSGSAVALSGAGKVAPAKSVLTATVVNGLHYGFVFSLTGSPDYGQAAASGNSVLRLIGETPFALPLNAMNRIDLYLDRAEIADGDIFRGGFFTDQPADFGGKITGATVRVFLRDDEGSYELGGRQYELYDGSLPVKVTTVGETAAFEGGPVTGRVMSVRFGDADSYAAWVARVFPDPADRENVQVAGPDADPRGEGIPNRLRYALEIDPSQPGRMRLPQAEVMDGRLSLIFARDPAKSDIAYLVEASTDLVDWSEVLYDSRVNGPENTNGEKLRVLDTQAVGEAGRRFMRLRIEGL